MRCIAKVICPVLAAVGIWIAPIFVHSASPESIGNWLILSYALIGFAIGALITGIIQCIFCKGKAGKCDDETKSCDSKKGCDDDKGGCH